MSMNETAKPLSEELLGQIEPNPENESFSEGENDDQAGIDNPQEEYKSSKMINSTDVAFIPLDSVKLRLRQIDTEIAGIHEKYRRLLTEMETTYSKLEADQKEQFQEFLGRWKEQVKSKIQQYQEQLAIAQRDKKELKKFNDQYVANLQEKLKAINEEKKELLTKMSSQYDAIEQERANELESREKAYETEMNRVRGEKRELEENVIALEKQTAELQVALAAAEKKGSDLQARYFQLVLALRQAKLARDKAKDAVDALEDGPEKTEAAEFHAQYTTKVEDLERQIEELLKTAAEQGVAIQQLPEEQPEDELPQIIKRISLMGNAGNTAEMATLRADRDRLRNEIEQMKSGLTQPGLEDSTEVIALKAQLATMRTNLNSSETRIAELEQTIRDLEAQANSAEAEQHKADAAQLLILTNANNKYEEDLREKEAEREKLLRELDDLKRVAGEAHDLEAKLAGLTTMLDELKKSNSQKEQELKDSLRQRKLLHNQLEDLKGKIRVFCRIRPLSQKEVQKGSTNVTSISDEFTVNCQTRTGQIKPFVYDSIFGPEASQDEVFEDTMALVQSAVDGYNVCIFAYGQTGSGKTFTIQGEPSNPGITPRAITELFRILTGMRKHYEWVVSCYMVELYLDQLCDLLIPPAQAGHAPSLVIKKDPKGMVTIPEVTEVPAGSPEELYDIFIRGNHARHTSATQMNDTSSRSHLVFSVFVDVTNHETNQRTVGKLSLVDLAGSERVKKSGATAQRLKEGRAINKSLTALGDVISALSSGEQFIPYRNNKLTMLMSDSMGGNAKTLMFVNISPASYNQDETVQSLTYAARVKLITNEPVKNVETREMSKLKAEIMKMQVELEKYKNALHHSGLPPTRIEELLEARYDAPQEEDFDDPQFDNL